MVMMFFYGVEQTMACFMHTMTLRLLAIFEGKVIMIGGV